LDSLHNTSTGRQERNGQERLEGQDPPAPPAVPAAPARPEDTILLVVFVPAHFSELIRAARLLRDSGRFTPVVWFAWPYREIDRDATVCDTEKIRHLRDFAGSAVGTEAAVSAQRPARRSAGARVWHLIRAGLTALPFPVTAMRAVARQGQ